MLKVTRDERFGAGGGSSLRLGGGGNVRQFWLTPN
jgi:hypothetical protein